MLDKYFRKCFKKIRITNRPKSKTQEINILMEQRRVLKSKELLNENEENELVELEENIALKCEEMNKKKVIENFKELDNQGDVDFQGIWKIKKKYFPKNKPTLPAGKKNLKQQLKKKLYLETFKYRLRHRPAQPGFEKLLNDQEELFDLRLEVPKAEKTKPWI